MLYLEFEFVLRRFQALSGLKLNLCQSKLFGVGLDSLVGK